MKAYTILLLIIISIGYNQATLAQDAFINQYEFAPTYLNPSFTGESDASIRILSTYINQWSSSLGVNSYKTGVFSIDTKTPIGESNVVGIGILTYFDKAGSTNFRNSKFSLSSSITHYFNKSDDTYNAIVLGVVIGQAFRKIDSDLPDVLTKTKYLDLGSGFLWKIKLKSRLKIRLGFALLHLNKPNVSLIDNSVYKLRIRSNLHADIEIPITNRLSLLPNYISSFQGLSKQHQLKVSNKLYFNTFNTSTYQNWVQLSLFGKFNKSNTTGSSFNTYGISTLFKWKSIIVGVSIGHHIQLDDNTFEFSFGYRFTKKELTNNSIVFEEY